MLPPSDASDQLISAEDAFDIPVFVRRSSPLRPERRPLRKRIDDATLQWPRLRDIPPDGGYMVTATWRDIVYAAMTVGRDPTPWLAKLPRLAWSELIARWSPLVAYLRRTPSPVRTLGSSGFLVEPNAVYREGTEKTAQAAFGYRIGMTMAEWACRSLMGLGPTQHAESNTPAESGPFWSDAFGLPDLVGSHHRIPRTWVIEAKGARRPGLTMLRKGASQVARPGLMTGPHVRVLCGASLEHRLFVTVDIETVADYRSPTVTARTLSPEIDDTDLLALARSHMLAYYSLIALPASAVSVVPIGRAVAEPAVRQRHLGLVYPLEQDRSTAEERRLARSGPYASLRSPEERLDMLTGQIPGTDVVVGISRRLFAACENLAANDEQDMTAIVVEREDLAAPSGWMPSDLPDEEVDYRIHERREFFASRESASRPRQLAAAREGFERGRASSWPDLLHTQPELETEPSPGLLEAATPDAYLAVNRQTIE